MHNLFGIGIEDRDSSERPANLSKHGPRSQREALIRALPLLVIDEASMMQRLGSSLSVEKPFSQISVVIKAELAAEY